MTRVVGTPLRVTEFSSPSDEAVSARVSGDNVPRIRIDAGGRITWSDGSATGDTKLYRSSASALMLEGELTASLGVATRVISGSPGFFMPNGSILVDESSESLYFRVNDQWVAANSNVSLALDDLSDVITSSVSVGDALKWDGSNWVNGPVSVIATLDDLTDVTISALDDGQILRYSSASTGWYNDYENAYFDGGSAASTYGGGLLVVTGGGASG